MAYNKFQNEVLEYFRTSGNNPFHLFPQWFLGTSPLTGSGHLRAPDLTPSEVANLKRLYASQTPVATVAISAVLWFFMFPLEHIKLKKYYGEAHDVFYYTHPMQLKQWGTPGSHQKMYFGDMMCLPCVRSGLGDV